MNKQLELFLARCELAFVEDGKMFFTVPLGQYFNVDTWAGGEGIKRDDSSLLTLTIELDKTGAVALSIYTTDYIDCLDYKEFSFVNATLAKIEEWVVQANTNLDRPFDFAPIRAAKQAKEDAALVKPDSAGGGGS